MLFRSLKRAKLFLENALKAFDHKFISKRYLIDAVIELSSEEGYKRVCPQIANLTVEDKRRIDNAGAADKEAVISMCLRRLLEESATATAA